MFSRRTTTALALAGVCALASAASALADPGIDLQPAAPAAVAAPGKSAPAITAAAVPRLRGYVTVSSGRLAAPNAVRTRASATCPANTVPIGGGAFVESVSTFVGVSSSFPSTNRWIVDINNGSGADTTVDVRVICAQRPRNYSVAVSNPVVQHSGNLAIAQATCPAGTRPLGGGGLTTSPAFAVNMNSTLPTANGWRVDESDFFSEADSQLIAVAVCGSVRGYTVVAGDTATTPAGGQTISRAICPAGKLPISGGVISFSSSQIVFINTTAPSGIEWDTYMNNRTTSDVTERAIAVCARAPA